MNDSASVTQRSGGWSADTAAEVRITLFDAMTAARRSVALMTEQPIDGVAKTERQPEGGWKIVVETIEAAARMGDNDLLSAYEVTLAPDGELTGFTRLARYHREDGTP